MTVGELKKKLEGYPDDTLLVTTSNNFELKGATVPLSSVWEIKYVIEKKRFMDAFDYEWYTTDVISRSEDGKVGLQLHA